MTDVAAITHQKVVSAADAPGFLVEAQQAARVLMRKSPQTQRTYQGIYTRFAAWLATRDSVAEAPVTDFTPEAFVAYLDEREPVASPSTVKKERAALRKLARYLHQLRLIDATVILMVEIPTITDSAPTRQGLEAPSWERVLTVARARLTTSARSRHSAAAAARDLALVQVLGGAGLRSAEARSLPVDPFDQGRSDTHGGSVYLRVHGSRRWKFPWCAADGSRRLPAASGAGVSSTLRCSATGSRVDDGC